MEFTIQPARNSQLPQVSALLASQQLPVNDFDPSLKGFWLASHNNSLVATAALEVYGHYGLLRSVATDPAYRNRGAAAALTAQLLEEARLQGLSAVYLVTTSAKDYFAGKGFREADRATLPEAILQSGQLQSVCPASATVMVKEI